MKILLVLLLVAVLACGALMLRLSSDATSVPVEVEAGVALRAAEASTLPTLQELGERIDRAGLERLDTHLRGLLAEGRASGEDLVQLSHVARWLGRTEEAVQHGVAAVAALPDSGPAHLAHAKALAAQMREGGLLTAMRLMGGYKDAAAAALAADPDSIDCRIDHIGFLIFAPGLAGGDRDAGRELARALVEDDPVQGHVLLALADMMDEDLGRAESLCREALLDRPDAGPLHLMLASALAQQERWDEASLAYERVLETDTGESHYRALYERARMRLENEFDQEDALVDLDAYARARPYGDMLPSVAGAWWRMGQAHDQLGRVDDARAAYVEALRLDPELEEAQGSLEDLN